MTADAREPTFGVILPIGRRLELLGIPDPVAKWDTTVAAAQQAEALGYDSVWVYDHLHNVPVPTNETVFECWTTLAALSQQTGRVRLGHLVGNNLLRPPTLVAKMAATVDVMSRGRLDWGIGTGWDRNELEAYGYALPPPSVRIDMLAEAVQLVRALWTQSEVEHVGRYYCARGAQCDPKPVQRPHPPIWIGGAGERRMLRVVAELADCSNFGGSPSQWGHKSEVLTRHCEAVGRDPSTILRTWSHDAYLVEDDRELDDVRSRSLWGETADEWRECNLVGTPDQVAARIHEYIDHGCHGFLIWCADAPGSRTLELFAREVIPRFREVGRRPAR